MRITHFERDPDNPAYSFGAASSAGGKTFLFIVSNATGTIERLEQIIEGERFVIPDADVPMFMRTLLAVKCADERWRHGEAPFVVDLRARP